MLLQQKNVATNLVHAAIDKTVYITGVCITFNWYWIISHLSFAIEAKDLKADAWSASSLDLVQMSEKVEPRPSPSIVKLTLCQNTQQCGLSRVHITQYSHSQVQELQERNK